MVKIKTRIKFKFLHWLKDYSFQGIEQDVINFFLYVNRVTFETMSNKSKYDKYIEKSEPLLFFEPSSFFYTISNSGSRNH